MISGMDKPLKIIFDPKKLEPGDLENIAHRLIEDDRRRMEKKSKDEDSSDDRPEEPSD